MAIYRALSGLLLFLCSIPVQAAIVFDFVGNHPVDGKTTATFYVNDQYRFGERISAQDFIRLDVRSKKHSFSIHPQETTGLFIAMNVDGSLALTTGNFQFYMDTATDKFFGTRTDGTWRAKYGMYDGNLGKWRLRTDNFRGVCLAYDNFLKAASRGDLAYVEQCLKVKTPINRQDGNG